MQRLNRENLTEGRPPADGGRGWDCLPSSRAVQQASSPYRRPKLKITEIRTAEVRVHGYQVHVRVYTDQGIVGQGESTDATQGNVPLIQSFARMLIGPGSAEYRGRLRAHPHRRHLRRRAGRPVCHGAHRRRNRAVGYRRQGAGPADVSIAGRQGARPGADLLRFRRAGDDSRATSSPKRASSRSRTWASRPPRSISTMPRDPARFDRVNWTASNGEIDHMVAKVAFTREFYPKNIDLAVDMHGALRRDHGQARRQGSGAVQADVAGRAGAGGKHRRHARHSRTPPARPSAAARTSTCAGASARSAGKARRRHHHARFPEDAAACSKRARSPTWRTPITCRWRRTR